MVDSRGVIEAWLRAVEAKDPERIAELLADNVSVETEAVSRPIQGKRAILDLLVGTMDAYDEIRIEPRKVVVSGRDAAMFVNMRVKFRSDIQMLGETLSTAGKKIDVVGAIFVEVDEAGKIARVMRVRDTMGLARQLGISSERMEELTRRLERKFEQRAKPRSAA